MPIKYVIRPPGIRSTPRTLANAFNAQTLNSNGRHLRSRLESVSRTECFFTAYPSLVDRVPQWSFEEIQQYTTARAFAASNKSAQRATLEAHGFPVPRSIQGLSIQERSRSNGTNTVYIGRPYRHRSGFGWQLYCRTTSEAESLKTRVPEGTSIQLLDRWDPSEEYLCELFPKTHEYRIIIVRGTPLITLFKRIENRNVFLPWNHSAGSSFVTVNDINNNRLRHTNIYQKITDNQEFFSCFDLMGLDVMFNNNTNEYSVCEGNLCPALTIESNIERIVSHVNSL